MKNVISALLGDLVQKFPTTAPDPTVQAAINRNRLELDRIEQALAKANAQVRSAKSSLRVQRRLNAIRLEQAAARGKAIDELNQLSEEIAELESSIQEQARKLGPLLEKWGGEVAIGDLFKAAAPRPGFAAEGEAADAPEPPAPAGVAPRPAANWEL